MESERNTKKRYALGAIHQALNIPCQDRNKKLKKNIKTHDLIRIWYANADTLTKEKIEELKQEIISSEPPDVIAITEIKPKNYKRQLSEVEYKI